MTLRERLIALADDHDERHGPVRQKELALAAARMALEEWEYATNHLAKPPHTYASENADRYRGFRDGAVACQKIARALRDGLE